MEENLDNLLRDLDNINVVKEIDFGADIPKHSTNIFSEGKEYEFLQSWNDHLKGNKIIKTKGGLDFYHRAYMEEWNYDTTKTEGVYEIEYKIIFTKGIELHLHHTFTDLSKKDRNTVFGLVKNKGFYQAYVTTEEAQKVLSSSPSVGHMMALLAKKHFPEDLIW